ncbi:MAG: glycoside hydrolase [Saprospiraceae bacterium]|nr:MAG: glycoside hydrolase [Saprospiraceae bacterium]
MHRLIISITLICLFIYSCTDDSSKQQVEDIIATVKAKFAPDKRVALLDYTFELKGESLCLKGETNLPQAKKELLRALAGAGFTILDSLTVLPSADLEGQHSGIVNLSVCNIRSAPKHSAELATQALLGTPLKVWKKQDGFFLVQTPDGYLGWLDAGGFVLTGDAGMDDWRASDRVIITAGFGFVLESSTAGSSKVSDLVAGDILRKTGQVGSYTAVAFPDGRTGFVASSSLLPFREWLETRTLDAAHILATAHEMMGRPYLWGGTSGKGMDCSGFTQTVYFLNGIMLQRDANQQADTGEELAADTTFQNLLPGDLLFFGRPASGDLPEKIWHVAIYEGSGKIIHASERVKVESLRRGDAAFNEERLNTYVRASRILSSAGANGIMAVKDLPF